MACDFEQLLYETLRNAMVKKYEYFPPSAGGSSWTHFRSTSGQSENLLIRFKLSELIVRQYLKTLYYHHK